MPAGLNPARAGGDAVVTAEPEGIPDGVTDAPADPGRVADPWATIQEAGIRTPVGDGAAEVHQVSSRTRARSSPAVSRRWNKISGAGLSISGGDNHEQDQDTAGQTSSSMSTGDSRAAFLAELKRPPARELNFGGMDSRHS